jgi:vacuolar protein sorting-associated protein 13A/C
VEGMGDALREGGGALAKGLFRGVTGILTKPVEGALRSGVEGFVTGVGKGLIGAAAQPVSGALDLVSNTAEGVNATYSKLTTVVLAKQSLQRCRFPRAICGDFSLRPYDAEAARGQAKPTINLIKR